MFLLPQSFINVFPDFTSMQFASDLWVWGLLSLVPLVILYLIRPKPKLMTVPSLMFFVRTTGANKLTSFLKQVTQDWLFIIQLLFLIAMIGVLGRPFMYYEHDVTASNTVLVVDVSASMQVQEGSYARFEKAVRRAKDLLGVRNTVVLAKQVPFIGVKDANNVDTVDFLNSIRVTDTPTRLGDSILLAGEALAGREGRVIVLSDFVNTGGQDVQTAKGVLKSKGITVDFVNVAERDGLSNVGFVDADVADDSVTAYIRNFDSRERTVRLASPAFAKDITLAGGAVEPFSFQTSPGETRLVLQAEDDFEADNVLRVSAPAKLNVSVLLITNNESVFLANALTAGGFADLEIAVPPIVPRGDYEIYILQDISEAEILSGTLENIEQKVQDGATAIIHAQDFMDRINYRGLLPGEIIGTGDRAPVVVEQLTTFTKGLDFGSVERFPILKPSEDGTIILSSDGRPLLYVQPHGAGKLVFYGILEGASDFKFAPDYPVFWTGLLKFLTQESDIRNLNYDTSQTMILDRPQPVVTPSGLRKGVKSIVVLDEAGFYRVGEKAVAVNLLDEMESSLVANVSVGQKSQEYELHPVTERRKFDFDHWLLIAALVVLVGEVLYVKLRGEV